MRPRQLSNPVFHAAEGEETLTGCPLRAAGDERTKEGKEGRKEEEGGEATAAGRAVDTAAKTGSREQRTEGRAAKRLRDGRKERRAPRDNSGGAAAAAVSGVFSRSGMFNTN